MIKTTSLEGEEKERALQMIASPCPNGESCPGALHQSHTSLPSRVRTRAPFDSLAVKSGTGRGEAEL